MADQATPTPVWEQCEVEHGIRAVQREVPWVNGEAIDDTGTTGERFRVNAVFHNSVQQEDPIYGLDVPLYPNRLEELCALFRRRKIGTLNFLTRRNVR
jgi:hypothetical protein